MMKNFSFLKIILLVTIMMGGISCVAQKPKFTIYQTQHWDFGFGQSFEKVLYKSSIDVKDKHLTGLLLAKRLSDTTLRIVFSNEVGIRFFDIEFNGEKSTVHYMFPSMDKKVLVSIIEDDLRMIFIEDFTIDEFKREDSPEMVRYTTKSKRGTLNYSVDKESMKIRNITTSSKKVKQTTVNFTYDQDLIPTAINVENPFIDMTMKLTLIRTK